jgi:hypothetical protein
MIHHDLSPESVDHMVRVDLATVTEEPPSPIGYFDFHDCICGIGSFVGRPPWQLHTGGDELLHILSGECRLTVREEGTETTRQPARRSRDRPSRLLAQQLRRRPASRCCS